MKRLIQISCILLSVIVLSTACDDNELTMIPCEDFIAGMVNDDDTPVGSLIDGLGSDLLPQPTANDGWGQEANLNTLVQRIEDSCDVIVSIGCYACAESSPPLSYISINFTENDSTYLKTMSIVTPNDDVLSFGGM